MHASCARCPLSQEWLTLLRSQKILTLLVFWGLFRPQTLTDLPATRNDLCPPGSEKTPENRSKVNQGFLWAYLSQLDGDLNFPNKPLF